MKETADFIPSDDTFPSFSFQQLIDAIKKKYGKDCDLSKVYINACERRFKCFGYDLYDPDDHRIEFYFDYFEN